LHEQSSASSTAQAFAIQLRPWCPCYSCSRHYYYDFGGVLEI
jgi:hypothetical protein